MIKAVIFDIDGVLIDSFEANIKFYQNLLVAAGYPKPAKSKFNDGIWRTMRDQIELLIGNNKKEIKRVWNLGHRVPDTRQLFKKPQKVLSTIKSLSKDYKLAVVTSRIRQSADVALNYIHAKKYFTAIITFDDVKKPKPNPEPLLKAIDRLEVKSSEAVYIGDSKTDILAAFAAKMKVINYYQFSKKPLKGADVNIKTFDKIPNIIKNL